MKTFSTTISLLVAFTLSFSSLAQAPAFKANETCMEVRMEDGSFLIRWTTTKEINSSYFLIEKSGDSIHFTAIKMIHAAGNSPFCRHYEYADTVSTNGSVYYRVSLVTMNGEHISSSIVSTTQLQSIPMATK